MKLPLNRRRFLGMGAAVLAYPFFSRLACFASPEPLPPDRSLAFFNTRTEESAAVVYCQSGCLIPPSLEKIDYILRDCRTGEGKPIDVRLLDLLHTLSQKLALDNPFHVISGYRCPETNQTLKATRGGGVAKRSLHMDGKAIDIRLPGVPLADVRDAALELKLGGVGYYQRDQFVHVDTGRVRYW